MSMKEYYNDTRIPQYISAIEQLQQGQFQLELPVTPRDDVGRLGAALVKLGQDIERRYHETEQLNTITSHINAGLLLDEILEHVYEEFRSLIPYNRIGFSIIESTGENRIVRAYWAKSDLPNVALRKGYSARLAGSSLEAIVESGQPRIINDLLAYAQQKPESASTQLILQEGIQSSLTCPLIINGSAVGFMFFSSTSPNTYHESHVELFQQIAGQLSIILEKGRLVSQIVDQQREIDRQNQELRALNNLKNMFLGIAAHDLRNPIGNIQMVADLLVSGDSDLPQEVQHELLNEICRQSEFMLRLLSDLLDISQIESGKFRLQLSQIEIAKFLEDTVAQHGKLAEQKGTQVRLEGVPEGTIQADPVRLRQVMDNLISNAVKYSPSGSTVTVSGKWDQDFCYICVQDEGPGLTDADRERLFQDFARLSARPTGGERSTGLGLSITKRIIEAHGGQIGAAPDSKHGTRFYFTLPSRADPEESAENPH